MEASLRKLRIETVDLMQVHNLVDVETHLDTLAGLEAGRPGAVRRRHPLHRRAPTRRWRGDRQPPVDFLQVNYSVGEREAERGCCHWPRSAASP